MALTLALERIGLNKQQQGFSGVRIEEAIEIYNNALHLDQKQESLGSRKVYYGLNQFHRSLSRKPQLATGSACMKQVKFLRK